jgi:hypothetical protein
MEARILALEVSIGLKPVSSSISSSSDTSSTTRDISARLSALEEQWKTRTSSSLLTVQRLWEESDALFHDLEPGPALTHQAQSHPIHYRKQAVLAAKNSLSQDMTRLHEVLQLLYISQKESLKDVTDAPILIAPNLGSDEIQRLDSLRIKLAKTQKQAAQLADRVDSMTSLYHKAMVGFSDHMIQLEAKIAQQGK